MFKALFRFLLLCLVLVLALGAYAWWWLASPLSLHAPSVELSIEPGTAPMNVAQAWVGAGIETDARLLYAWFRFSGQARQIRAGSYEVHQGITPIALLDKMVRGDEVLEQVRLIDGWTFRQFRAALNQAPALQHRSAEMSEADIMRALGQPGIAAEGRFYPDTYAYSRGVSDLTVMRRALKAMQKHLLEAWAARDQGLPLNSPDEALVMASLVEKETGTAGDRPLVAAVFINRLRLKMPLQTDPTVIYGLGESYSGSLHKHDLLSDTPFNTYTRQGLPPTPIAMPGRASLQAALHPAASRALYFVARGDGSSQFSEDLAAHNRAVNQYQRGR